MNQTTFTGPCPGNSPSPPPAGDDVIQAGCRLSSNSLLPSGKGWKRCRFRQALEIFWIILNYLEISWSILKYLEIDDWVMQDYTRRYQTLQDVTRRYSLNHKPWGSFGQASSDLLLGLGPELGELGTIQWDDDPSWCSISSTSIKQPIKRIYISVRD